MKKWIGRILGCGMLWLLVFLSLRREDTRGPSEKQPIRIDRQGHSDGFFGDLQAAGATPQADVQLVLDAIETYTQLHREQSRPIGLNEDLVDALTTRSAYAPALLAKDHPAILGGQLVDRWGRPFHLHALGNRHYTVRSAGPDRSLFTADDLVVGEEAPID